MRLLHS